VRTFLDPCADDLGMFFSRFAFASRYEFVPAHQHRDPFGDRIEGRAS